MKDQFFSTIILLMFLLLSTGRGSAQSTFAPGVNERLTTFLFNHEGVKTGPHTIVTRKGSTVSIINNKLIFKAKEGLDPFQPIIDELKKTNVEIELMSDLLLDKSARNVPLVKQTIKEFIKKESQFETLSSDEMELPLELPGEQVERAKGKTEEILKKVEGLKTNVITDVPTPPYFNFENGCTVCDSSKLAIYEKAVNDYVEAFTATEGAMISEILSILTRFAQPGVRSAQEARLREASEFLFQRIEKKIRILANKYASDPHYSGPVTQLVLMLERRKQLLGIGDESDTILEPWMKDMKSGSQQIIDDFYRRLEQRDYTQICKFPFILSLVRQQEILGMPEATSEISRRINAFNQWNRFKLTITIEYEGENKGASQVKAILEGSHFVSLFFDDRTKKFRWDFTDKNQKAFNYQLKDHYFKKNVSKTQDPTYSPLPYGGASLFTTQIQNADDESYLVTSSFYFTSDFCSGGKDTLVVERLMPEAGNDKYYDPEDHAQFSLADFYNFFIAADAKATKDNLGRLQQDGLRQIMSAFSRHQKIMAELAKKDPAEAEFLRKQMKDETKQIRASYGIMGIGLVESLQLQNNSSVLIDEVIDVSKRDLKISDFIVQKATVKVKLEHGSI